MDIFSTKEILKGLDDAMLISPMALSRLNKYIFRIVELFLEIREIKTIQQFYGNIKIFLYETELEKNVEYFCKNNNERVIKYEFHNNKKINTLICLFVEYFIYDILDMLYSYTSILDESVIKMKFISKILNNDSDFIILNQRNKIILLEDSVLPISYFKKVVKNISSRRITYDYMIWFKKYIEYTINQEIDFQNKYSGNLYIDKDHRCVQKYVNIECDSQTIHL